MCDSTKQDKIVSDISYFKDWFEESINYRGQIIAEYPQINGFLKGIASLKVTEERYSIIEVESFELTVNGEPVDSLAHFLNFNSTTFYGGDRYITGNSKEKIQCTKLTIKTEKGSVEIDSEIHNESVQIISGLQVAFNEEISYRIYSFKYIADNVEDKTPAYWTVPLYNFITYFGGLHHKLNGHPLRLYQPNITIEECNELAINFKLFLKNYFHL